MQSEVKVDFGASFFPDKKKQNMKERYQTDFDQKKKKIPNRLTKTIKKCNK